MCLRFGTRTRAHGHTSVAKHTHARTLCSFCKRSAIVNHSVPPPPTPHTRHMLHTGAAPTVLGCSGLPHAPPPPASVFPPKWPSWKEGEPKRRKATGEPFGKGPYLWKKGGPKATVPSGYTRSAESRPSGGYTTANEVWDALGRDSLEGLDLGRDSRCRTYRGTLRSGDARRGRAGGSQQASTPSLPRVWRRLLKKGHQTIAQSSSLPPSPKGRLAGEWACQSRSRTSYLRGRDHWRWCLHVPILDTSHRND